MQSIYLKIVERYDTNNNSVDCYDKLSKQSILSLFTTVIISTCHNTQVIYYFVYDSHFSTIRKKRNWGGSTYISVAETNAKV